MQTKFSMYDTLPQYVFCRHKQNGIYSCSGVKLTDNLKFPPQWSPPTGPMLPSVSCRPSAAFAPWLIILISIHILMFRYTLSENTQFRFIRYNPWPKVSAVPATNYPLCWKLNWIPLIQLQSSRIYLFTCFILFSSAPLNLSRYTCVEKTLTVQYAPFTITSDVFFLVNEPLRHE